MKRFALLLAIVLPFMAASLTSCEKATPTTGTLTVHMSNLKYDIEVYNGPQKLDRLLS